MKKLIITLSLLFILTGCSDNFQSKLIETPLGTNAEKFDDVSKFSNIYGMWKNNIDTLYLQAGIDEYTNTHLLDSMPDAYTTIIKSLNKYDMKPYALLNDNDWLKDENSLSNVRKILDYNSEFEKEKFKGININPEIKKTTKEKFKTYLENLVKTKEMINIHNEKTGDNLILSVNIDDELMEDKFIKDIIKIADEVIYENKGSSTKNVEKMLSAVDKYNKKISIVIDSDSKFFDDSNISILKNVNNKLNRFNEYNSFNGFIINDYNKYNEK